MEEVRTDEGELICECDLERGIVEIVRNGWLVRIDIPATEIAKQRKAGQKKTA